MCDTLYKKLQGGAVFLKNSDRSCNEPSLAVYVPQGAGDGACTYIKVEGTPARFASVLVKPSWTWGAEMGVNEKGVAIGNEAVFTKSKTKKENRLIGMDLVRLALERSESAQEAVRVITALLVRYGQGGNCGFDKPFYYDNSYLISDSDDAFVLETAGREVAVTALRDSGNISNRLSESGGFAKENSDFLFTYFSRAANRKACGAVALNKAETLADMLSILRSHDGEDDKTLFSSGSVKSICMHQSLLGDQTTGSLAYDYHTGLLWLTGASLPCLSVFKPVIFGAPVPPVFADEKDSLEYWLEREYLHRALMSGLADVNEYRLAARALEAQFISESELLVTQNADMETLKAFCAECSEKEKAFIKSYSSLIEDVKSGKAKLKGRWISATRSLGKNVFGTDYTSRK